MNNNIKISMLGGDLRQLTVARRLAASYENINVWGLSTAEEISGVSRAHDLSGALTDADVVVLPLPVSVDGVMLNAPLSEEGERVRLSGIAGLIREGAAVIGGKLPESFLRAVSERGAAVRDYFCSEDFQMKNAYTTAEAALSIAMNSLDKNIRGSRIAITGFGRISKHLAALLLSLGAHVCIAARRESDLSFAESFGCHTVRISEGEPWWRALVGGYDVIYNTVPYWIFGRDFLAEVDKKTFIVDLASAPGGVDIRAAKELGSNVSWATSLPGKYAPQSAGEIMAECVMRIISEVIV
ncbi:MAG: hypothetical protein J6V42_06655 [Clostridia bacterium]|nr:hypothetical protein [Clostridia bacterium]